MTAQSTSEISSTPEPGFSRLRDLFRLDGKNVLITGGSRGLGLQMAEAVCEFGGNVILCARRQNDLDEAVDHLGQAGYRASALACDISDTPKIPELIRSVLDRFGPVDVLVNNAGTTWGAPAEEQTPEQWTKVMKLNVDATFHLSQAVARECMIPRRWGRIINMASFMSFFAQHPAMPPTVGYNTSKAAVLGLTRSLAAEWGKYGINVNAIAPGYFPSKMTKAVLSTFEKDILQMTPAGRLGGDNDLKGLALLFASEAGRHITGQTVLVDGGASVY